MKIVPILSEKSLDLAKLGKYSFWVDCGLTKYGIKKVVKETFGVDVKSVRTANYKKLSRKNYRGKKLTIPSAKKAVVEIAKDQEIAVFKDNSKEKKGK